MEHDAGEHPHEAPQLALDNARAGRDLGWHPVWDAAVTLDRTARWYRLLHEEGKVATCEDLAAFVLDARSAGLAWA